MTSQESPSYVVSGKTITAIKRIVAAYGDPYSRLHEVVDDCLPDLLDLYAPVEVRRHNCTNGLWCEDCCGPNGELIPEPSPSTDLQEGTPSD